MDRFDRALFLSGYHDDAVISAGTIVASPAATYDAGATPHEEGQLATMHHLTNHMCDIEGDVAHCETYYLFVGRNRDETNWLAGGRYLDRVERRRGEWRIAFRHTVLEWSGSMPNNDVPLFSGASDAALNGLPSRDGADPSYRRPLVNLRQLSN
jgi:hypothetical protein